MVAKLVGKLRGCGELDGAGAHFPGCPVDADNGIGILHLRADGGAIGHPPRHHVVHGPCAGDAGCDGQRVRPFVHRGHGVALAGIVVRLGGVLDFLPHEKHFRVLDGDGSRGRLRLSRHRGRPGVEGPASGERPGQLHGPFLGDGDAGVRDVAALHGLQRLVDGDPCGNVGAAQGLYEGPAFQGDGGTGRAGRRRGALVPSGQFGEEPFAGAGGVFHSFAVTDQFLA